MDKEIEILSKKADAYFRKTIKAWDELPKEARENWIEVWINGYVSGYLDHKRYIGSISPLTEAHV